METIKELFETKGLIIAKGCFMSLGHTRKIETLETEQECKLFFKGLSKERKCIEFIFEETTITFFESELIK
tara:strand:+ start:1922 stop:2134 length:213 start_codon:yes stop_codon:yes gene_type:complete